MKLQQFNPILYLEEYEDVPEDFCCWKHDEELRSGWSNNWAENGEECLHRVPEKLCVGIGKYHTDMDGTLFLCALLDRTTREVVSCSFGVYRSPELVKKALEIFFQIYELAKENAICRDKKKRISVLSSRNPIYQTKAYHDIIASFPVETKMTMKGTRGGAAVVSTYFSQLMRRKGSTVFHTWQDAIDWLSGDIIRYNKRVKSHRS